MPGLWYNWFVENEKFNNLIDAGYYSKTYLKIDQPDKEYKAYAWNTAIGLQDVDGLKVSSYLMETAKKNIDGDISIEEAQELIKNYYSAKKVHTKSQSLPETQIEDAEADIVATNIASLLSEEGFVFSVAQFLTIHRRLFENILDSAGQLREYNISKEEWVLDGESVRYGNAPDLKALLEYDFEQEKNFSYKGLNIDQVIKHLARFIANLWQIHPFAEGNTRTVAVFLIKYLKTLGFDVTNDIFAENSWYFRNALVRANYSDITRGIYETTEYVELLLRNLLINEKNELQNRNLHVEEEDMTSFYGKLSNQERQQENSAGRPKVILPKNFDEVVLEWKAGNITATEAMHKTKLKRTTFYKYTKQL